MIQAYKILLVSLFSPPLPSPLRTLYDSEEQDTFLESLASRVRGHEKDIERMCNKNYQGFIESVSELLKVKSDAHKLKVGGRTSGWYIVLLTRECNVVM